MKFWHVGIIGVAAIALALSVPTGARAGGDLDDHDHHDENAGPSYFGFVKDHRGVLVADAKVTAELKNRGTIVTRTDILGVYKIPGFAKDVNPDDVVIACAKDGYRQLRVLRKPQSGDGKASIETECTLQRL
jgi:hypothetical protein